MHRKLVSVASGAALVLSILAVGVGTASGASSVTCKALTGSEAGNTTIGSCTPASTTYKTATAKSSLLAAGGAIKWAPSGKTTVISKPTVTSPGQGKCANGSTEFDATAKVTGGTATYTHKGDVVKGRVCLSATLKLTLVKGTSFTL